MTWEKVVEVSLVPMEEAVEPAADWEQVTSKSITVNVVPPAPSEGGIRVTNANIVFKDENGNVLNSGATLEQGTTIQVIATYTVAPESGVDKGYGDVRLSVKFNGVDVGSDSRNYSGITGSQSGTITVSFTASQTGNNIPVYAVLEKRDNK